MRVHHLNCISTCPLGGALMDGRTRSLRGRLACHCLAIETDDGLVLVDTGFGLGDVRHPKKRLSRFFLTLVSPEFREEMTAVRQLERLGFKASDVRHVVMTHLDFDHAGGIEDFPEARVHLLASERDAAFARQTLLDKLRYRPQQWGGTRERWHVYTSGDGEKWYGFDAIRTLHGVTQDVMMVPLLGHTLGHAGVAVKADSGWLFLTGDAYFFHDEMRVQNPRCTPGLTAYQWMMDKDHALRRMNQRRLRELKQAHGGEVRVFSSHDPYEFEALSGRPLGTPVGATLRAVPSPAAEEPLPGLQPLPA